MDKTGFFRGEDGSLTQLGRRLKFYDVSFVFANSPESKGKIERVHIVWQDRLPAYFEREGFGVCASMEDVNDHVESLVDDRNGFEDHREIGMTPQEAWETAMADGRSLSGLNGRERLSDLAVALLSTDVFARRNVRTGRRSGCAAILTARCRRC